MKRVFFIVGLPRSRTSWLALWLTQFPRSFCFHDGLASCKSPDDLVEKFRQTGADICGNSDSGLPLFHSRIGELFPEARYVFIERPMLDCWKSFKSFYNVPAAEERRAFAVFQQCDRAIERMKISLLGNPRVKTFRFAALNDADTARAIWRFCIPTEPFHLERWRNHNALHVQPVETRPVVAPELLGKADF
jgi:hypothetical protein